MHQDRQAGLTLIEVIIILMVLGILLGITAYRYSDVLNYAQGLMAKVELDQVQKGMWAYMVSQQRAMVPTAECVSDFGLAEPQLWPDYLKRRTPGGGRSYSWDAAGNITPCATAQPGGGQPGATPTPTPSPAQTTPTPTSVPSITPSPTPTLPSGLALLRLTSMCSPDPASYRVWRVRNPNAVDVPFIWELVGTGQSGMGLALANSDVYFQTGTVAGSNTVRILVDGVQHDVKASTTAQCASPTPSPTLTATASPTATWTPSPSPTPSRTLTPTRTLTPSRTPTPTPTLGAPKKALIPRVYCVQSNGDGTYTAFFGYESLNDGPVYLAVGAQNKITPGDQDQGQPTIFYPGVHEPVFKVVFTGTNVTWHLATRTATARRFSRPCGVEPIIPKPLPIEPPRPVEPIM